MKQPTTCAKVRAKARARAALTFEIYEDASAEFRWRVRARNNLIVADGAEAYTRARDCALAVRRLHRLAARDARLVLPGDAAAGIERVLVVGR